MAKVKIIFNISLFCAIFLNYSHSQIVKNSNLDLTNNSTVNDVKYNDKLSKYFVVGNFTSLGGINRTNLAVLNDSLAVTSDIPIQSINGQIKAIETDSIHIYIGGDFTSINGSARNGFAIFDINSNGTLTLNTANIIQSANGKVSDIELTDSNQVIILGDFNFTVNAIQHKNIVVIDKNTLAYTNNIFTNVQIESFSASSLKIFKTSSMYVVTGDHVKKGNNAESSGIKFTHSGQYIDAVAVTDDTYKVGRELIQVKDNLFSYSRKPSQTTEIVLTDINTNTMYTRSPNPNSAQSSCYGNQVPDIDQEIYNQEVFYIQDYSPSTTVIERYGVQVSDSIQHIVDFSSKWCTPVTNDQGGNSNTRKLIVANNKLFYHDGKLKKIEGRQVNNKGLVAFCLEPYRPTSIFKKAKPNPCEKVATDFKIDPVKNANGYEWSYTGTGASIRLASDTTAPFQPLSTGTVFNSKTANDVQIKFDTGYTDGEVIVKAFTVCNNIIDRLYSREVRTAIHNNTPTLIYNVTPTSGVYNCLVDSIQLTASANFAVEEYFWRLAAPNSQPKYGQTVTFHASEYDTTAYDYLLEIRYNGQGQAQCVKTKTVHVPLDTQMPNLSIASNYVYFNCSNTSLDLQGTSNNPSDILSWNVNGTSSQNPLHIDTTQFSNAILYFKGQHSTSHCMDSIPVVVAGDFAIPYAPLINGVTYSQLNPVGELTCANDSLAVTASNNSGQNNTFYWIDDNQNQNDSSYLTLNNLTDVVHVVGPNGCENSFSVFVNTNLTLPLVIPMSDTVINCSVDTITLIHPTNSDLENGWINANGNDSLDVSVIGEYIYEFINTLNGCVTYDTVNVTKLDKIIISFDKPIFACQDKPFSVSANAIGIESPFYTWNTGESTQNANGIGGTDSLFIIQITGENNCSGTDTLEITTAPTIQNHIEMFLSCDEDFIFMNNVVVSGGIAPFTYSIDGLVFQDNNTIEGLTPGDYSVYIQDASSCIYAFPVNVTQGVAPPNLHFLASTYNKPTDLVALVNTTSFGGFDTVYWQLPTNIHFEYETDSIRFISASDTGYFDITLVGMIDTCMYTFTKQVYFGAIDSIDFNTDPSKGIQNLSLYPNPNTGVFSVDVTFGVEQHFAMYIADIAGNIIAHSAQGFGINHVESFDISSYPPGTYVLRIIADFDAAYFPFVKN